MLHNFAEQSVVILNVAPGTEELCFGSALVKLKNVISAKMHVHIDALALQESALLSVSLMSRVRAQSLSAHQQIVVSDAECGLLLLRAAAAAALRCCPPVCNDVTRLTA